MSIGRRIERLEGMATPEHPCTVCDPGPGTMTIVYGADDPDARFPPGDPGETIPLKECSACGRRYRTFTSVKESS